MPPKTAKRPRPPTLKETFSNINRLLTNIAFDADEIVLSHTHLKDLNHWFGLGIGANLLPVPDLLCVAGKLEPLVQDYQQLDQQEIKNKKKAKGDESLDRQISDEFLDHPPLNFAEVQRLAFRAVRFFSRYGDTWLTIHSPNKLRKLPSDLDQELKDFQDLRQELSRRQTEALTAIDDYWKYKSNLSDQHDEPVPESFNSSSVSDPYNIFHGIQSWQPSSPATTRDGGNS